jgi:catechol 2,3-dioxygenase-like lactoylglutathione lyase family enzyme
MTQFKDCIPIITVRDVKRATSFYVDVLGFSVDFETGAPDFVTGLFKDAVQVMLIGSDGVNVRQRPGTANVNFFADEVDDLFSACRNAAVEVIVEPGDRDYGQRDFAIRDPDGNVLVFGCAT